MTTAPPPLDPGGDPPGATWLNQLVAFVQSGQVTIDAGSGLTGSSGAIGWSISTQDTPDFWVRLTFGSATGQYSWVEQIPAGPAQQYWTDGTRKGSTASDPARVPGPADPAYEAGGNANLPVSGTGSPYRVLVTRDKAVGRLTFRARQCAGGAVVSGVGAATATATGGTSTGGTSTVTGVSG
jgi:hypothetical protein